MSQIFVFGDSIAHGAWDKAGGWATRLRNIIDKKGFPNKSYDRTLYNLAISGNTSEDLTRRFEFEIRERLSEDNERVILFAIGINDSQFVPETKTNKVAIDRFKENIQKLIDLAKKITKKIIFVGLILVNEPLLNPLPWKPESFYRNRDITEYNNSIRVICENNHIDFIDVLDKWKKLRYIDLLEDGLHPNTEGHKKIFETLKEYLLSHNIISSL